MENILEPGLGNIFVNASQNAAELVRQAKAAPPKPTLWDGLNNFFDRANTTVQRIQPVITAGGQLVNTTRQTVQQGQQAFSNQPATVVMPQPARPGMSNSAKIGIAVAVVAIVGGTIYFATKK
jgi:hypothetical protein